MSRREVLLALGMAVAVAGLGIAFVPALGRAVDSPTELPFLLGVVAIAATLLRLRPWLEHDERNHSFVERERPTGVDAPGEAFDGRIRRAPARDTGGGNTRLIMIRQALRETAIDTLTTYHGHTPESARRALDAGTWTDDEYAVEFFTTTGGTGNSLTKSVTASFYGESPFHRRADRAAREIERLSRGTR